MRSTIRIAVAMKHVARVAKRVGCTRLAHEAGLPESTVREYALNGWRRKSLTITDALIAAADRIANGQTNEAR
jgi:hypothetical protein